MKSFTLALLLCSSSALAADFHQLPQSQPIIIRPQIPDLVPNDGILDAGSYTNPYMLQQGNQQYEIRPQIPDLVPNDGVLDGGSYVNPWVVEPE